MTPPTILLWHWGRRGGGPRYTLELARALAVRPDLALYLSYSRQAEIATDFAALGVPSLAVDTYSGPLSAVLASVRLPWLRRRFAAWIREKKIDVVVCTMNHVWNVAMVSAIRPAGARYVMTLHDAVMHPGEENQLRSWSIAHELSLADGVVTLSQHVHSQLIGLHGYPAERSWVIPHGVFDFGAAAARSFPASRPFRLLFFGRILPYKGVDVLLDAYGRLRAQLGERVELTIAGSGDLSPYATALASVPGITLHNRWIAENEVGAILEPADLVVLPYREASQSGVVASAYGAGVPVVVTPVGGLSEQVADGVTGCVARDGDAAAVAEAVAALIADPLAYERVSAGALAHAGKALSWNAIADQFMTMIHDIKS